MPLTRRHFLRQTSTAFAAGAMPALVSSSKVAAASDYKALVCVFLNGGNDAWNTVAPVSSPEYSAYASARGLGESWGLALEKVQFQPFDKGGRVEAEGNYGMHPGLKACHTLYEEGDLAIVSGIGPLVKPTTKAQYLASSGLGENSLNMNHPLPSQLFGHNTQVNQWHTLNGAQNRPHGWAGRALDALQYNVMNQMLPASISTNGRPQLLVGSANIPYVLDANGIQRFFGLTEGRYHQARAESYRRIMSAKLADGNASIYAKAFAQVQASALENALKFQRALDNAPEFKTFPNADQAGLASQLRTVAKIISARDSFNVNRQIFFVEDIGFDLHDHQMRDQPRLLSTLDAALGGFSEALKSMGVWDNVVTFTQSDFGRTLTSNGDGSDHGWSGLQFVVGGAVSGGEMVGTYPILELDREDEIGNGIFIPDISVDQYAATLSHWFGVPDPELDKVCPQLANFVDRDLGFLGKKLSII